MNIKIPLLIVAHYLAFSVKLVKEGKRIGIFRRGRFLKVAGPGLILVFRLIDSAFEVDLNTCVPDWRNLSKQQLDEKVKQYIVSDQAQLKLTESCKKERVR